MFSFRMFNDRGQMTRVFNFDTEEAMRVAAQIASSTAESAAEVAEVMESLCDSEVDLSDVRYDQAA